MTPSGKSTRASASASTSASADKASAPRGGVVMLLPSTRDPRMVEVHLCPSAKADKGKRLFVIPRTCCDELKLRSGMRWTAALSKRIQHAQDIQEARKIALQDLGRRSVSTARLRQRLIFKGCSTAVAERIVDELLQEGWLNDASSAQERARILSRGGRVSRALIMKRLQAEGFDTADATRACREALPADTDIAPLVESARIWARRGSSSSRIAGRLARRGFHEEIIRTVLKRAGCPLDDEE